MRSSHSSVHSSWLFAITGSETAGLDLTALLQDVEGALGIESARPIAQGGQKIVLEGVLAGTPAIAKVVLLGDGPMRETTLTRAHREVELLAAVECDRVVRVLTDAIEVGEPPHAVCWVEERLDGEDLATALARAPWTEDAVWALLADIGQALEACHELEVVHRDLSPGNVRQTSDGRFVLMDPGLARHLAKTALTGAFQPGTPGFRSPEHVPGGDPIPASDIFALGILAYYAISGQFPIDPGGEPTAYDRRLVETQAQSIAECVPTVSKELAAVVDRCLERQPARRYVDGNELLQDSPHLVVSNR